MRLPKATRALAILIAAVVGLTVPLAARADYGSPNFAAPTGNLVTVGDPVTADVWVVGDSITSRSHQDLLPLLAARKLTVYINALGGRTTGPMVDWVLAQNRLPKILVMAAGSNDVDSPPVMAALIARLKAAVPVTTKLIWVDVQVVRSGQSAAVQLADQRNSMWVNAQIYAGVPNVCRWSQWFAVAPWRLNAVGGYLADGVHPKPGVGTKFWAAVMNSCIK